MDADRIYPQLVTGPLPAGEEALAVVLGHGVKVRLVEGDRLVTAAALRAAGLTADEAHDRALENLTRFAEESPDLTIEVLGSPGDPVHLLLYSDHPLASACLLLPDLYEEACERLQTAEVCAVVLQRESLVVFPKRDRAAREALVAKLRELEADVAEPISFGVFELTAVGVRELADD